LNLRAPWIFPLQADGGNRIFSDGYASLAQW